jgi:hypothetical protein
VVQLYGKDLSLKQLRARTGSLAQFAGVRPFTLEAGAEQGVRCLEFRTGTGFSFTVLLDRGMDIGDANHRGASLGWHSPTGFRHPSFNEPESENGFGVMRSFSGLLMTCGLDHILGASDEDARHFNYPHRDRINMPLHGRAGFTPATLGGFGLEERKRPNGEDELVLWCQGEIRQAAVFGENLRLVRRIEARVGESAFTLHDRVDNLGFSPTPHMFMYHINLGYPVLDEGSRYLAPVTDCLWTAHEPTAQRVGYRTQAAPQHPFEEQVYEHQVAADAQGRVPVALVNDGFDSGRGGDPGLGFAVEYQHDMFPSLYQWQCLQSGLYAFGIEPSTNHVLGRQFARERQQLQWLEHGDRRDYETRFSVLDGSNEIKVFEQQVENIAKPLASEFVTPSGRWR